MKQVGERLPKRYRGVLDVWQTLMMISLTFPDGFRVPDLKQSVLEGDDDLRYTWNTNGGVRHKKFQRFIELLDMAERFSPSPTANISVDCGRVERPYTLSDPYFAIGVIPDSLSTRHWFVDAHKFLAKARPSGYDNSADYLADIEDRLAVTLLGGRHL